MEKQSVVCAERQDRSELLQVMNLLLLALVLPHTSEIFGVD